MQKVIEVTPRDADEGYHASFSGNTAMWGQGHTVEKAVISVLTFHYNQIGLTPTDIEAARFKNERSKRVSWVALANIIKAAEAVGIEIKIEYNPMVTR